MVQKYGNWKSVWLIPRKWLDRLGSFSGIRSQLPFKREREDCFKLVFLFETFNLQLVFSPPDKSAFHSVTQLAAEYEKEIVTQD